MAKRQSEIEIPFTQSGDGTTAWAIVDHKVVLEGVKVDDYFLVFDKEANTLIIAKRDHDRKRRPGSGGGGPDRA